MVQFRYTKLNRGHSYPVLPKIFVIALFRILLHGIFQNFACNTLKDDIGAIFVGIGDAAVTIFPEFFRKIQILDSIE